MVIVRISGGMGNQLFQYAAGRQLANKLNTELKLDVIWYKNNRMAPYTLDQFNTIGTIATPEEIEPLKKICMNTGLGKEGYDPIQKVLNYPDNIYLDGDWCSERYFPDIRNLLLKEITLKNPLSPNAEALKQKILSAKCAVSLHFRHGDFLYNPVAGDKPWFHIPPFEYYYNCINTLKQVYENLTVFVFSNNMEWVKENLNLDVPTEFVEGRQEDKRFDNYSKRDIEEMYLMSLCKHNINPRSAFSWWGAYLNQNPDKKVFISTSATAQDTLKYKYSLTTDEKSPLESGKWIYVPFDRDKQPKVVMRPIYSLLLVVNNDAATIADTLNRILGQDYKYYEVIIIDNASTDGSGQICQQAIAGKANVTFKKLWAKVKNAEAWNIALDMAQGYYVSFLKGNDRFMPNTLSMLYLTTHWQQPDFVHSFAWLAENDKGNIAFGNKKCTEQRDVQFVTTKSSVVDTEGQNAIKLLLNRQINNFLGTKLYNRNFLLENEIKFDEHFGEYEAELYFQMECFFKSKYFMYVPNAFYVASKNALEQHLSLVSHDDNKAVKVDDYDAQIISKFNRYFTARVDIRLVPKTAGGDFQILSVSDDKATIRKNVGWLTKGGNIGHVISSYVGQLEFVVKSTSGGRIRLRLRGLDVRTPEDKTKRIPYWVDYTKFIVNGTTIFDQITPTWHDKFYNYEMDAKAGEEVKVQVEWLPHIDNAIDEVVAPTPKPEVAPTPAVAPTPKPAVAPTPKPAVAPTPKPEVAPTPKPAVAPTPKPAVAPTPKPAVAPTPKPAVAPTPKPAVAPTPKPAVAPTPKPAVAPTPKPAVAPTPKPAVAPTPKPAVAPTPKPAVAPTPKPAVAPTTKPAVAPTTKPAVAPTPKPAVAPTTKPAVAKEVDMRIVTGRLDIQLVPITKGGDFQILSISDDKATVWKPGWFQQDGIGYQIQSYAGKLEFIAKATVNGQIRLNVKGLDVRDAKDNSKRVPYWIDFTKLIVNGKVIFDKLTPAWHDKPYIYNMEVKSGEEVKIQVEWLPHKSDT